MEFCSCDNKIRSKRQMNAAGSPPESKVNSHGYRNKTVKLHCETPDLISNRKKKEKKNVNCATIQTVCDYLKPGV